ncbi:hypothetical protein ARMGADRAFT_937668, partial [Armillaria gallica]
HLLHVDVCIILRATMGMESAKMEKYEKPLALSEAGFRKQMKATKRKTNKRLPPIIEWEVVNADSVVLLRIRHALMCMWQIV